MQGKMLTHLLNDKILNGRSNSEIKARQRR